MHKVAIHLSSGAVHVGRTEQWAEELLEELAETRDDMPAGWAWIAGVYVRPETVIAIAPMGDDDNA